MSRKKIDFQVCSKPDTFNKRLVIATADGDEIWRDLFDINSAAGREKFYKAVWNKTNPGGYVSPNDIDDYDPNSTDDVHPLAWIGEAMIQRAVEFDMEAALGGSGRVRYDIKSAAELDAGDYTIEEAIEGVLVDRQPMIILGASKAMKTTFALAMALALALGVLFLGRFRVTRARRVLVMSGESGLPTVQETLRRQCAAEGIALADVENLFVSGDIPQIANALHLGELKRVLVDLGIEVFFLDPLYLAADTGGNEGSLFAMGAILRGVSELCQSLGVTLIILHHLRKNNGQRKGPPELADASWSGIGEYARQWCILDRQKPYVSGSGLHELNLSIGGSAGHGGFYGLTIDEGTGIGCRRWDVTVQDAGERIEAERAERESGEADRRQRVIDEHAGKLRQALKQFPNGETAKGLRDVTGLNGPKFHEALSVLRSRGEVESCEVRKGNKTYDGLKKRDPHSRNGSAGPSGSNDLVSMGVPFTGD